MKTNSVKTILLVEDEPVTALAASAAVKKFGYNVITASTGEEAVTLISASPGINLVLMDIDLGPGIDGTEAARQILSRRELPIVFLTSHSEKEYVDRVKEITRYGYIIKNSGAFVLQSSIEMAFELFESHQKTRRGKAELATIYKHAPFIMMLIDKDKKLHKVNGAAEKFADSRAEDMIGLRGGEALRCLHHLDDPQGCGFGPSCGQCAIRNSVIHTFETGENRNNIEASLPFNINGTETTVTFLLSTALLSHSSDPLVLITIQDITNRKKAEAELIKSEERFFSLFERAPLGYQSLDDNGCFIEVNETWTETLGYSRDEIIGKWFGDFLAPEFVDLFRERFPLFKKTGKVYTEFQMLHKDGNRKTIAFNGRVGRKADGSFLQTHCILSDITDRKKTENELNRKNEELSAMNEEFEAALEELAASNEQLHALNLELTQSRAALLDKDNQRLAAELSLDRQRELISRIAETSPVGITYVDPNGKITFANIRAEEILGLTRDTITSLEYDSPAWRITSVDGAEFPVEELPFPVVMKTGRPVKDIQHAIKWPDGRTVILSINAAPLLNPSGAVEGMIAAIEDITERKKTEASMTASDWIFKNSLDMLCIAGFDGYFKVLNPSWSRELGWSTEELLAKPCIEFVHPEDRIKTDELKSMLIDGCDVYQFENRYICKDGSSRWLSWNSIPLTDHGIMIGVVRNITDKKADDDRLKNFLEEKEMLLREVHHRVKNNMTTIISLLSLHAGTLEIPEAASVLNDAENRMRGMMLLYDRLYRAEHFDAMSADDFIGPLARDAVTLFPRSENIIVETDIEPFMISAKQLSPLGIILNEIVSNAMKHAFREKGSGRITITASRTEGGAILSIEDNGTGMPADYNPDHSSGFGMKLISILAKQLRGSLKQGDSRGTKMILEFRL